MNTLDINHLCVSINQKEILKDFNLKINEGEIHVIMGPNGTGKSTLSKVIMGDNHYQITKGSILYKGKEINHMTPDERARMGIFMAMQMPTEIEGVSEADFLRTALHEKEREQFHLMHFIRRQEQIVQKLGMDKNMIHRSLNEGFSGGEKKKNEILQMYLLEPSFVILDEIDSGLDVDSLRIVGESIMDYYQEKKPAILIITHYQRLLNYIKPDYVHIMENGCIQKTGDANLVVQIEKEGFDFSMQNSTGTIYEK